MQISHLDHLVLTVRNIDDAIGFYTRVLGMEAIRFGNGRHALRFGTQKINLHEYGNEFEPKAGHPTPGAADLCFITTTPLSDVLMHLTASGIEIIEGPAERTSATGPIISLYFHDPDRNLIEVANRVSPTD